MAAPIEIGATMQHLVLHCPSREAVLVVDRVDGRLEERWGADGASVVGRVEGGWRRCGAVLGVMRWTSTQEAFLILAPPSQPVAVLPPLPTLQVAADAQVNIHRVQNVDIVSFITARPMSENEVNSTDVGELAKELSSGNWYYSPDADMTRSLQSSLSRGAAPVGAMRWARCDDRFFWNRFLVQDFLASPSLALWVAPMFQGCVEMRDVTVGPSASLRLLLISRKSKLRPGAHAPSVPIMQLDFVATTMINLRIHFDELRPLAHLIPSGTRYKDRGVDDDGNVANYVETEQVLLYPNGSYSAFVQIRGSVPVFWEQPAGQVDLKHINIKSIGNSMGKTGKITLARSHEASRGAFAKHFATVYDLYGLSVLINLLSNKKEGELLLTQAYQTQLSSHRSPHIKYVAWDFHEYCKQGSFVNVSYLLQKLQPDLDMVTHHAYDASEGNFTLQRGVFRTNCKDCLDRTNIVQMILSGKSLEIQMRSITDPSILGGVSVDSVLPALQKAAESAWVANGDAIARAYAGTGAMKSSIGGGLKALLADGKKSIDRYMQATFLDQKKNEALLSLLGVNGKAIALNKDEIDRRQRVFSISHPMVSFNITIATKNLNGVLPSAFNPQHLLAWLTATPNPGPPPDMLVIGFQEIVQLTPGKVLSAGASANAFAEWSSHLTALVDAIRPGYYVLIASGHLVGLALFVFASQTALPHVRDVQRDEVKTGMGGMTGNKGAVGVRCTLHSSSLSFVCAHLAAGQKEVLQRDADVATINTLMFKNANAAKHAKLPHRLLFWLGDFNYRIDMARDEVLAHIAANRLAPLLEHDELGGRLRPGQPFDGFEEGAIMFDPTYKYDPDSEIYDTSAKGRTPAWCDRVLWRAPPEAPPASRPVLASYARCELLRLSDHRAVAARFSLPVVVMPEQAAASADDGFDPRSGLPSAPSQPIALPRRSLPFVPGAGVGSTPSSYSPSSSASTASSPSSLDSTPPQVAGSVPVKSHMSHISSPPKSNSWRLPDASANRASLPNPAAAAHQANPSSLSRSSGQFGAQPPPSGHRRSTHALEPVQPSLSSQPSTLVPTTYLPSPPSALPQQATPQQANFVPFFPPPPSAAPPSIPTHPSSAPPSPHAYSHSTYSQATYMPSYAAFSPQYTQPPPASQSGFESTPDGSAPAATSLPLALMVHSSGFSSSSFHNPTPNPVALPLQQPPLTQQYTPPSYQQQTFFAAPPVPERRPPSPRPPSPRPFEASSQAPPPIPTRPRPPSPLPSSSSTPSASLPVVQTTTLPSAPTSEPSFFPPPVPATRPAYQPSYQRY